MYPDPEATQVIVSSMNMGYISDTARSQTHNLFRPKREPIPLGHSDWNIFKMCKSSLHLWGFVPELLVFICSDNRLFSFIVKANISRPSNVYKEN